MATEEWIKRSIVNGKLYDDLPPRVKAVLPLSDWKLKVKDHCTHAGFGWNTSLAQAACTEGEYYEDLLRYYRHNHRLFPYHLADYVCRTMRVTPFRYYCDLLYTVMREEKSYDRIPNFTAADIVRLVGIGRNEYISIMNKCKAKKLLWRVNKSIVKEMLPTEPMEIEMQHWWIVSVVNLGETEYRQLTPTELKACERACKPGGARVADIGVDLLQPLYRRGLIYLEVPIRPDDHFSIPPLEGFVSNKDSEKAEDKGDPLEAVLYGVFVATSARASVAELAKILSVDQVKLQAAVSIACRLGFATRLPQPGDDAASQASIDTAMRDFDLGSDPGDASPRGSARDLTAVEASAASASASKDGAGIALVVDAEVTSYLMMGAMSPGLKRHSVTLFEGGRVTGTEVISELIRELHASVETAMMFEGDMKSIAGQFRALAAALECVRAAGGSRPLELLRKESLAGLAPAAASRVLSHAYAAVVPITPLPAPPLPLTPSRPGPTNFGTTVEAATPWLQLALYRAADCGPPSLVLVCGQRFWRLPPQLASCTHALLWPWDPQAVRAQGVPIVVEATFLLFTLNEHLSRTAVLIQPLVLPAGAEPADLPTLDVPLPISARASGDLVTGFDPRTGEDQQIHLDDEVTDAAEALGLAQALGCLKLLRVVGSRRAEGGAAEPSGSAVSGKGQPVTWLPLQLQLGMPLQPDTLCSAVCRAAQEARFLEADTRRRHEQGQALLQKQLFQLISEYGACSNCLAPSGSSPDHPDEPYSYVDLPIQNLLVGGATIQRLDLGEYLQGIGAFCVD